MKHRILIADNEETARSGVGPRDAVPAHLAIASVGYAKSRPGTGAAPEAVVDRGTACLEILTVQTRHGGASVPVVSLLYAAIPAGYSGSARSCRGGTRHGHPDSGGAPLGGG